MINNKIYNNNHISNNKQIINFKFTNLNNNNQKINVKIQEWIQKTLGSNQEMVTEFYGINYDQLILEPLSVHLEKVVKKLNESINIFNLLKRNIKNEKANDKLVSLYDEIAELNSGIIDAKSNCLKFINSDQINKIILQKYSMGSGVSRVGGSVNLLVASVSADVDPKGLKNFYTSYHKLYWVSRHLDNSIRSLFTLFEDSIESILNEFSIVYDDLIDNKKINNVLDKINHFKENLSIEIKEINQPPPLLNLLINNSSSQVSKLFKIPIVSETDSLDLTIIDQWFEFVIGEENIEIVPFSLKYSLLEPVKLNLLLSNKKLTNISKYLNQFNSSGNGELKLESIKELFKLFENDEKEVLKSKEKCLELLLQDNVNSVIRGKKRATVGISSIINFDEFKLPGSQKQQVTDKAIQELTNHLTESFDSLYNLIISFLKSLKDSFSFFDKIVNNDNIININQIKEYQDLIYKIQNSLVIEATTLSTLKNK